MNGEADFLEKCYKSLEDDENAADSYRIKVHAMKSSAALIGIAGLSQKAKELEMAAKDGDLKYLHENTEVFLNDWRSYKEKLSVCIKEEEKEEILDITVIEELMEKLKEAMEFMDIDTADELMKELRNYKFTEDMAEKVESLGAAVVNLDTVSVNNIIDEIKKLLQIK
jgi:HPt (histidine-containing phosphotransfer) domain-containing protein